MIVSKKGIQASAHYRVLRRGGANAADLLVIYVALVRSVLEYCCVIWHNALPAYLSKLNRAGPKASFKDNIPTTFIPGSVTTC